ncbi:Replication factor C subunit 5 like protein [Verticillium longisporum]|nr:Replication factor C subunit 5 like protein [Verticillium longisporum]
MPMGGANLQNPSRQLGGNVSFAQSLGGSSQPSTPLDPSEFPSLSNNPQLGNANQSSMWATAGSRAPAQNSATPADDFPPLNRNANGEIGGERGGGLMSSLGFGAQAPGAAPSIPGSRAAGNGLLNALSANNRSSDAQSPPQANATTAGSADEERKASLGVGMSAPTESPSQDASNSHSLAGLDAAAHNGKARETEDGEASDAQDPEKVTDSTRIPPPDWEALIGQIAKEIMEEHTPARILQVRAKLYDLLTHCIPATTILKTLTFKLVAMIDDALKPEVIKWSAYYEHRIRMGTKVIFHLEAFVAKFMRIIEIYLMSMDL